MNYEKQILIREMNFLYTREQLREIARRFSVPRGQNKLDTIKNIIAANQVELQYAVIFNSMG